MLLHIHTCLTGLFQQAKVQLAIIIISETGQATNPTIFLGTSVVVLDPKADQNLYNGVPRITQISTSVNPRSLAIIVKGDGPQMSLAAILTYSQGQRPRKMLLGDGKLQRELAYSSRQSATQLQQVGSMLLQSSNIPSPCCITRSSQAASDALNIKQN